MHTLPGEIHETELSFIGGAMKFWATHIALYLAFWLILNLAIIILLFPGEPSAIVAYGVPALGAWAIGRLIFRKSSEG